MVSVLMPMQAEVSTGEAVCKPLKPKRSGAAKPSTGPEKAPESHGSQDCLVPDAALGPRPQPMPVSFLVVR